MIPILVTAGFVSVLIILALLSDKYLKHMIWFGIITYLIYFPIGLFVGVYAWMSEDNVFAMTFIFTTFMVLLISGFYFYNERKRRRMNRYTPYLESTDDGKDFFSYKNRITRAIVWLIPWIIGILIITVTMLIKIVSR